MFKLDRMKGSLVVLNGLVKFKTRYWKKRTKLHSPRISLRYISPVIKLRAVLTTIKKETIDLKEESYQIFLEQGLYNINKLELCYHNRDKLWIRTSQLTLLRWTRVWDKALNQVKSALLKLIWIRMES